MLVMSIFTTIIIIQIHQKQENTKKNFSLSQHLVELFCPFSLMATNRRETTVRIVGLMGPFVSCVQQLKNRDSFLILLHKEQGKKIIHFSLFILTNGILTTMVHAINPGFSLWSRATKNRRKAPAYQRMAAKKNPNKNLQQKHRSKVYMVENCIFHRNFQNLG